MRIELISIKGLFLPFHMYIFFIFFISLCSKVGSASINITSTQFLRDPDEITSINNYFKLGFFSPPNSTNRYVGIWYNTGSVPLEVVWIANRDNPVKDTSGVFKLSEEGDLRVSDEQNNIFWSSNTNNSSVAELQDSGNLVMFSSLGRGIIWQSFEHPTDTFLPLMKIGIYHTKNKTQQVLQSGKSPWDPSRGRFTIGLAPSHSLSELFMWKDERPYWRSGPWNGNYFIGLPSMYYNVLTNLYNIVIDDQGQLVLMYSASQNQALEDHQALLDHYVLNYDGSAFNKVWNESDREWQVTWRSLESECDVYGKCGTFAQCNLRDSPICSCLEGFKPTNNIEWRNENWTSGCSRRTPLQCDTKTGKSDGFLRLQNIKVPDMAEQLSATDEDDCRRQCKAQCSCLAYAYYLGIGCMMWNQTLIDIQVFNITMLDLFVRLAHSELPDKNSKWKTILVIVMITGAITLTVAAFSIRRCTKRRSGKGAKMKNIPLHSSLLDLNISDVEFKDLPLFELEKLADSTANFHLSNKLGQGGFGPVFKGKLEDGQEIAVKRLSIGSGQGLREFMNEVLLISKLQHRNLVRLLGCCVEGDEKLLVYEYMPNKSLDALLFDPSRRELLDWKKRLNIIKGICRGLLYLHRDSRLRIIHRDLKASNILLDEDLNPKISDFGMAKIFGSKEDQGNTSRVVGTYGYMSPEYAMEGRFSEKSDIYSFGVLLLEIVSGRRNNSFRDDKESFNLLAHVWKYWNQGDILSLIDPTIDRSCIKEEIIKCIQLGLLCVQELPEHRPTVSAVILVLDTEVSDLPCPLQPGFLLGRNSYTNNVAPYNVGTCSSNNVSITCLSGR